MGHPSVKFANEILTIFKSYAEQTSEKRCQRIVAKGGQEWISLVQSQNSVQVLTAHRSVVSAPQECSEDLEIVVVDSNKAEIEIGNFFFGSGVPWRPCDGTKYVREWNHPPQARGVPGDTGLFERPLIPTADYPDHTAPTHGYVEVFDAEIPPPIAKHRDRVNRCELAAGIVAI